MEIIKIKRCISNYVSKESNDNYGKLLNDNICVNVYLTQKMEDQGIFTDFSFNPLLPYLTERPTNLGEFNSFTYGRFPAAPLSFYINESIRINGTTDDGKIANVSSYRVDVNTGKPIYVNDLDMTGNSDLIFTGVINQDSEKIHYVINAESNNINSSGIHYITFFNEYVDKINSEGNRERYRKTDFYTDLNSINDNIVTLSAITKQSFVSLRSFSPRIFIDSFGLANLTSTSPFIFSKSKTCMG